MVTKCFAVQVFTIILLVDIGTKTKKSNIAPLCTFILRFNSHLFERRFMSLLKVRTKKTTKNSKAESSSKVNSKAKMNQVQKYGQMLLKLYIYEIFRK